MCWDVVVGKGVGQSVAAFVVEQLSRPARHLFSRWVLEKLTHTWQTGDFAQTMCSSAGVAMEWTSNWSPREGGTSAAARILKHLTLHSPFKVSAPSGKFGARYMPENLRHQIPVPVDEALEVITE